MAVYWLLHDTVPGVLVAAATQSAGQLVEAQEDPFLRRTQRRAGLVEGEAARAPTRRPTDGGPATPGGIRARRPCGTALAPDVPPAPRPTPDSLLQAVTAAKRMTAARSQAPLRTDAAKTVSVAILYDKGRCAETWSRDCASRTQPGRYECDEQWRPRRRRRSVRHGDAAS